MTKSSWFVAFVFFAALLAVFGCAWIIGASFVKPGNATTTPQPAALIAEVATMEPTATSTPDGSIPTQQALLDRVATAQAENNKLQEQIRQINIEAQTLETRKIEAQAASNKALADKARADADKAAQDAIRADIELKKALVDQEEIEIKTAMVSAVTQQKQAETGRITNIAMVVIVAAFVILGAIAMFRPRAQLTTDNRDQELTQHAQTAALIPKGTDAWERTSFTRIPDPPGDPAKIILWAETVLAGGSVAVDVWEQAGPFTGNREYRHGIYAWLVRNNLIVLKNKMILNDLGIQIVTKYVENHSPTQEIRPETSPTPSVSGENSTDNSGGGGESIDNQPWTPFDSIK